MTGATMVGLSVLETILAEADRRAPHVAVDSLLMIAQRMEREQGGRLTEFQVRTFAAFLLGAQRLPADAADPDIAPEWLVPKDAERYAEGAALVPPNVDGLSLTRH